MLRLYICQNCRQYFPAASGEDVHCPMCEKTAVPTEYMLIDLLKNNADVTREIYRKYNIEYEEFTDMMARVDKEEQMKRTLGYKIRRFFGSLKSFFYFWKQKKE